MKTLVTWTLEDSSFSFDFREVSLAIILNLFWVVFHGILSQMSTNLYRNFTSDVIKLSQKKNDFKDLTAFWFTFLWRYIIVESFISVAFVIVQLKISKVLRTNSASTKQPIIGGFWALTPPIWQNIVKILTRCSVLANKNSV